MASRSVADLHPALQEKCIEFIRCAAEAGIRVQITCTYRSEEEQRRLYAQGRTTPGPIVTWTLRSKHLLVDAEGRPAAEAFDVVILGEDARPTWDLKADIDDDEIPDYRELANIALACGLRPGAEFGDYVHFELKK